MGKRGGGASGSDVGEPGSRPIIDGDKLGSKRGAPPRKAIALRYEGKGAPRITAGGQGLIADQILDLAREHQIPVHEDPALAAVLAQIPVGDEIPQALYVAIAEVLAFVYLLSGRRPGDPAPGARTSSTSAADSGNQE